MAFNVQTAGDEAIFVPWPGYTGTPTPTSGRSISGLTGKKELRYIKDSAGKVIWAHKWRVNLTITDTGTSMSFTRSSNAATFESVESSGSEHRCSITFSSNDPSFIASSCIGFTNGKLWARCKNDYYIKVTVSTGGSKTIDTWGDGSGDEERTFKMTAHINKNINLVNGFKVNLFALASTAASAFASVSVKEGSLLDLTNLRVYSGAIDTLRSNGFVPDYNESTGILNLMNSSYSGWEFTRFVNRTTGVEITPTDGRYINVTAPMDIGCIWHHVYTGKYVQTSKASNKNVRFLFNLSSGENLRIPTQGNLKVGEIYGLLTHAGGSTGHEMCVAVSLSDITGHDSRVSNIDATSSTIDTNPTLWKETQNINVVAKTSAILDGASSTISLPAMTAADPGSKWDVFNTTKKAILPYGARKVPIPYSDWIQYISSKSTTNKFSTDQSYVANHPEEYKDHWESFESLFTNTTVSFGLNDNDEDTTLDNHLIGISGVKYTKITTGSTVIGESDVIFGSFDGEDLKREIHIVPCCSPDVVTIINGITPTVGDSVAQYQERLSEAGAYVTICKYNADTDEIEDITDETEVFEVSHVYYAKSYDDESGKDLFYLIVVNDIDGSHTFDDSSIPPAYSGETVNEYKARVLGLYSGSRSTIDVFKSDLDPNSGIYVKKNSGAESKFTNIYYKQTGSGISISNRATNQNILTLVMYKTNGCPVRWEFFIYKLEITLS